MESRCPRPHTYKGLEMDIITGGRNVGKSYIRALKKAEELIQALPTNNTSRNDWLLSYGTGDEAKMLREAHASMDWPY